MADQPMQAGRIILALDTAMQGCSAAALDRMTGTCVSTRENMARGQSERLIPMIDQLLDRNGIAYSDIALVVTTVGPGAFTGLRIGISAARALATALDVPVAGVTTLEVLACEYRDRHAGGGQAFAVILETKRSDFYVQFFDAEGQAESDPEALDAKIISGRMDGPRQLIGDGAERYARDAALSYTPPFSQDFNLCDPCVIARLGLEQFAAGRPGPVSPLYLRDADVSQAKTRPRSIAD